MNNFLLIIAAILVLILTALFAVPPMVNWNDFRGAFEEEASRLLDREVRVRGEVSVRILPVPYVSFEKVRIADAPGVPGSFARADQFKMWLSVPPLLRGVIEARQIELEQPVIRLRTEADGSGNWRKLQISKRNMAYIPSDVALKSVLIKNGTLLLESHHGHEITKLTKISGEMTAGGLTGPYKFIGEMPISDSADAVPQEVRLSTASAEDNGDVRFSGSVRSPDGTSVHNINGTFSDLLGSARAVGQVTSRNRPARGSAVQGAGYEFAADLKLDAQALRLEKITVTFQNKDRQQTLNGSAVTSWREGVATQTNLSASWLDLDAIAGSTTEDGPLRTVERLLTRGIEPLGAGVTSLNVSIDQANLAGTAISNLKGRMIRRDGVTKIEALRALLPGLSALAVDGFLERRKSGLQFDGHVLLRSASFTELAQWGRIELKSGSARALATSFSLNSTIRVRSKSWQLTDTIVQLADATAEGEVGYDWSSRPALVATIDADRLALEKFGTDLLQPARMAAYLGFPSRNAVANPATTWRPDTDIALSLRANQITDGNRIFDDVNIDVSRTADGLGLTKFDLTWQPGLKLALSGKLTNLKKHVSGRISGALHVTDEASGKHLTDLVSLAAGKTVPALVIAGRTPLRLAIMADLGKSDVGGKTTGVTNHFIADGSMGRDRIRIDARTFGQFSDWHAKPAEVQVRIDINNALVTTRRMLGADAGTSTKADAKATPATVVMTAAGTPAENMKTFVRIAGGNFLDADFSGGLSVASGDIATTSWQGHLDIRRTTAKALALLSWPAMHRHIADTPIRGRIELASTATGYRIEPKSLRLGRGRIAGKLELVTGAAMPRLTGNVAFTDASLQTISHLLMRADAGKSGGLRAGSALTPASSTDGVIWPDTPFDFAHLVGIETQLAISIKKLVLDARGNQLSDAAFHLATSPDQVKIGDFSARSGTEILKGKADFQKSQAGVRLTAEVSGKKIALAQWAPELARTNRLSGTAAIKLRVQGRALSPRSLSTAITGKGSIQLAAAKVPGVTSEAVTALARKVVDGEIDIEALGPQLQQLSTQGTVKLGAPTLKFRIADGTMTLSAIVFDQDAGAMRNQTFIDLPRLRIDSRWTVTPAPQPRPDLPGETVALPPINIVYAGAIADIAKIEPKINPDDLERELVVRRMEANVARLEQLRREDEARAAAEAQRQRDIEEEQRRSIEEEQRRRQQAERPDAEQPSEEQNGAAQSGRDQSRRDQSRGNQSGVSPASPPLPSTQSSAPFVPVVPVPGSAGEGTPQSAASLPPEVVTQPPAPRRARARRRPAKKPFNPFDTSN